MNTRRSVLGALGTTAIALTAGCQSMAAGDGNGTASDDGTPTESTEGTGVEAPFHDWIGPEMANVQWITAPNEDIDGFNTLAVTSPAAAISAGVNWNLPGGLDEDGHLKLPIESREITLDVDPPELYIGNLFHEFSIFAGSFDAETLSGEFADATTHDQYRDHEVVTEPAPERENPHSEIEIDELYRGVAFNDRHIVIAHVAPSESRAVEFVHLMLDTWAGAADRLVETNEDFGTAVDELGEGVRTRFDKVGLGTMFGSTTQIDGDTAVRRGIKFYETEAEAADSMLLDERRLESARESQMDDRSPLLGTPTDWDEFEADITARHEGRYVVLEETFPTKYVGRMPWATVLNATPDG